MKTNIAWYIKGRSDREKEIVSLIAYFIENWNLNERYHLPYRAFEELVEFVLQNNSKESVDKLLDEKERNKYDCSCFVEYPNKAHRHESGKWKCVDKFEKCEDWKPKYPHSCVTHCRRKEQK